MLLVEISQIKQWIKENPEFSSYMEIYIRHRMHCRLLGKYARTLVIHLEKEIWMHYELKMYDPPPNSYDEAITPNVTVFGGGSFGK